MVGGDKLRIPVGRSGIPNTYIHLLLTVEINIFINCLYSPSFCVLASSLYPLILWGERKTIVSRLCDPAIRQFRFVQRRPISC